MSLDGLQNLEQFSGYLSIYENWSLRNFCAISKVLSLERNDIGFSKYRNAYNPTREDILAGNCSQ